MRAYVAALTLAAALVASNPAAAAARSGPYSLQLIDERGRQLPTYQKDGRTFVLGSLGKRYSLKIHNGSSQRVEFVSSVDGRDVIDGKTSSWARDGYVVEPYGEVVIDGFRLSHETVAAFRFSNVDHSYASKMGDARDVGVIGVAVFPEKQAEPVAVEAPPQPHFWNNLWGGARAEKDKKGDRDEGEDRPAGGGGAANGLADISPPAAAPAPMPTTAAAPAKAAPADPSLATGQAESQARREQRPGLGTEFGEQRDSHVNEVQFVRASSQPAHVLSLRYDDRAGLLALGIDLDPARTARLQELRLRATAEPFRENGFSEPPTGWSGR